MNCPKCGAQTIQDQKFCRSCGASVQMVTQPLVNDVMVPRPEDPLASGAQDQPPRGNRFFLWGFIIMFIGVAIGVIGKMLIHQDIVTVVGVLVSLLGMFLTVYPFLVPSPRQKPKLTAPAQPEGLREARPSQYLPQGNSSEYLPSITERTTGLLENAAPTRTEQYEKEDSQADTPALQKEP